MDIRIIANAFQLCNTTEELETYIREHIPAIRLHFYGLSTKTLRELTPDFERLYSVFKNSPGYTSLVMTGAIPSDSIKGMLLFFASIFDRTSANTNYNISSNLPDSSVKFRLKAKLVAEQINNIRTDYITTLPRILELLSMARFEDDEDYTQLIVSFLVRHYFSARDVLQQRGYNREFEHFRLLFSNPEFKEKYDFLKHPMIAEAMDNLIQPDKDLQFEEEKAPLYYPSEEMHALFQSEVINPLRAHPRSTGELVLGYHGSIIRRDIIRYGRADFRLTYGHLSADDLVLLYCYYNMRKHYFTTYYLYERIYDSLMTIIEDTNARPVFIDLGCGPLTSGLAIGDLHKTRTGEPLTIHYIGIDIAPAMLRKALALWNVAGFAEDSESHFAESWNDIADLLTRYSTAHNTLIFNASYLFASDTLNIFDLAKFFSNLRVKLGTSRIYFVFQNPDNVDRNTKFQDFKSYLPPYITHKKGVEKVLYKNNPSTSWEPSSEDVYFEIFELA